jgi:hypothetical protein
MGGGLTHVAAPSGFPAQTRRSLEEHGGEVSPEIRGKTESATGSAEAKKDEVIDAEYKVKEH